MTAVVAMYVDLENAVLSRYEQLHGDGAFRKDGARYRSIWPKSRSARDERIRSAEVDVAGLANYARSIGSVRFARAFADFATPAIDRYKQPLSLAGVSTVQTNSVASAKNGSDIRLVINAIDDIYQHPEISHLVLVSGDSDFIPLVERARTAGLVVCVVGVSGSTNKELQKACDVFVTYDEAIAAAEPSKLDRSDASALLAKVLGGARPGKWQEPAKVLALMVAADPSFSFKAEGHASFIKFVRAHPEVAEELKQGMQRRIRLRGASTA